MEKLNNHPELVSNRQIDRYLEINCTSPDKELDRATIVLKALRQSYIDKEEEIRENLDILDRVQGEFSEALERFHKLVDEQQSSPDDIKTMYDFSEILDSMRLTREIYMAQDIVSQLLEVSAPDAVEIPSMKLSARLLKANLEDKADLLLLLKWQGEGTAYRCDYPFADRDTIFAWLYGDLDNEVITFSKRQNDILDKYGIN